MEAAHPRILSEQSNDYREICRCSAAIPKDGRVSGPSRELFNSFETKFYSSHCHALIHLAPYPIPPPFV